MRKRSSLKLLVAIGIGLTGATSARADLTISRLEQTVQNAADRSRAGAILDVQGCGISFLEARGVADRKTKAPMPTDERLRLASIGKLHTAVVIHELVKTGALDLDQPATNYLDDGTLDGVPNADATLRQMLNHTSGVPDYYDARSYLSKDWTKPLTADFAFGVAKRRKATNEAGAGYSYSNTNYQILALVAEAANGQDFTTLMQDYVIMPMSLDETVYNVEHPGGTIRGYGTELRRNADTWKYAENTGADGGITATTADLRKFLQSLFLDGGEMNDIGDALLSSQVQAENDRRRDGAGAEIYIGRDGLELVGHTGDTMGYLSFAFAIPEFQATIIGHLNADRPEVFVSFLKETVATLRTVCPPLAGPPIKKAAPPNGGSGF